MSATTGREQTQGSIKATQATASGPGAAGKQSHAQAMLVTTSGGPGQRGKPQFSGGAPQTQGTKANTGFWFGSICLTRRIFQMRNKSRYEAGPEKSERWTIIN